MAIPGYRAYGRTSADFVATVSAIPGDPEFDVVRPAAGTLTAWNAQAGGSQITDLRDAGGSAITTVTIGADGVLPRFHAPESVTELWVDGGGPRTQLIPADLSGLAGGGAGGPIDADDITDATATGKAVLRAGTAASARAAIGAPALGTVAGTAADAGTMTTALAGKSNTGHGHAQADVSGLSTTLAGKSDVGHGHAQADVSGLAAALDARLVVVEVVTGSEARPAVTNVLWKGGATQPTNMALGDVWLSTGA